LPQLLDPDVIRAIHFMCPLATSGCLSTANGRKRYKEVEDPASHIDMIQQVRRDIPDELVCLVLSIASLPHPGHMSVAGAG
jgi:hypothetical protein